MRFTCFNDKFGCFKGVAHKKKLIAHFCKVRAQHGRRFLFFCEISERTRWISNCLDVITKFGILIG